MTTTKPRAEVNPRANSCKISRKPRLGKAKRNYYTRLPRSGKPLPLFGHILDTDQVFVICGDGALDAAHEPTFRARCKLVLPPDRSPFDYRWPVAGRHCWIVERGANRETKLQVQGALMQYGAANVWFFEMADWYIS